MNDRPVPKLSTKLMNEMCIDSILHKGTNKMVCPVLLDNPLHELEVTSYCRKFFSSGLNFLKLDVEWIVLVVFNPEK
jgi:hypothetical protein